MSVHVAEQVHALDALEPSPIPIGWVVSGTPSARVSRLAANRGATQVVLWDCTDGTFDWRFGPCDETVHILEGSVTIVDHLGQERLLGPGDVALFHAGTVSRWTVHGYVRKLAVLHDRRSLPRRAVAHYLGRLRPAKGL